MIRNFAAVLLVIVWLFVIFMFSNSDGKTSSATSSNIADKIVEKITDAEKTSDEYQAKSKQVSFIVRKMAHFTEYFILGLLLMNMMFVLGIKNKRIILSVIIIILYACSDEIHQVLISGRDGNIKDVLLDSSAGMIATYIYYRFIIMRYSDEKDNC